MTTTTAPATPSPIIQTWLRLLDKPGQRCYLCPDRKAQYEILDYHAATEADREAALYDNEARRLADRRVWAATVAEQRMGGAMVHKQVLLCREHAILFIDEFMDRHVGESMLATVESETGRSQGVTCVLFREESEPAQPRLALVKFVVTIEQVRSELKMSAPVATLHAKDFADPYETLTALLAALDDLPQPDGWQISASVSRRTLRLAVENVMKRFRAAKAAGRQPGFHDAFHDNLYVRLPWERRPGGAYETLVIIAAVMTAEVVIDKVELGTQMLAVSTDQLRRLMRFLATDPGISIDTTVLPYSQRDLRRAYEEFLVEEHP